MRVLILCLALSSIIACGHGSSTPTAPSFTRPSAAVSPPFRASGAEIEIDAQLWAAADYHGPSLTATARGGESVLTLRVPAATRILLVGARSQTRRPQPLPQPHPFDLTTVVR